MLLFEPLYVMLLSLKFPIVVQKNLLLLYTKSLRLCLNSAATSFKGPGLSRQRLWIGTVLPSGLPRHISCCLATMTKQPKKEWRSKLWVFLYTAILTLEKIQELYRRQQHILYLLVRRSYPGNFIFSFVYKRSRNNSYWFSFVIGGEYCWEKDISTYW